MKYSYNWLKELSSTNRSPEEVAELLITHAFEVEEVLNLSEGLEDVVVGHVQSVERHPDADRLREAMVDIGGDEGVVQIVCGAPNLAEGQKVPVAKVGAVLPGEFKIKKSKIRGVESNGMICAEDEIGLGTDHDGIMVLDADAPTGESFAVFYGLDDHILDIDILPNRGHDALSHRGVAREICALEGRTCLGDQATFSWDGLAKGIDVSIDSDLCSRYTGVTFEGVEVKPSPVWLQNRLRNLGVKVINNIVDITNYVMLETGQPLHAFDARQTEKIVVRSAQAGERLVLLDDQEIELVPDDLLITDGEKPVALAGVMGGKDSGIADDTQTVVLEAAKFDAATVRRSRMRNALVTDAAHRFERDPDQVLIDRAVARAGELINETAGGKVVSGTDLVHIPAHKPESITVTEESITRLLGIQIPSDRVTEILMGLHIDTTVEGDVYTCTPPTERHDLRTPADIIEEIGRVWGYDQITPVPLPTEVRTPEINDERAFEHRTKDLWVEQGYSETRAYSFYSLSDAEAVGEHDTPHVTLQNPLGSEQEYMRHTLAPGLLRAASKNQSYADETLLFETGRIYTPSESGLPEERFMAAVSVTSKATDASQFYMLKGAFDAYCAALGITATYVPYGEGENSPFLHPSRAARIMIGGAQVGFLGEVSKKSAAYFGIKKSRTAYLSYDMRVMAEAVHGESTFVPLAQYPSVMRDLSLIVPEKMLVADVERAIYDMNKETLTDIDLFDLYVNPETGKRSMAFHLIFSDPERTLTAKEVDAEIAEIMQDLETGIGVTLKV